MSNGPFRTKEAGNIIALFTKDELFPIIEKIRELSIEISGFRVGFFSSFTRSVISNLETQYKKISVNFIKIYHKWSTPDILFSNLKVSEDPVILAPYISDYFNSQQAVMQHFNEGFRLLNYIDRILTDQSTASYNRISISLSLFAIVISIILFLIK